MEGKKNQIFSYTFKSIGVYALLWSVRSILPFWLIVSLGGGGQFFILIFYCIVYKNYRIMKKQANKHVYAANVTTMTNHLFVMYVLKFWSVGLAIWTLTAAEILCWITLHLPRLLTP